MKKFYITGGKQRNATIGVSEWNQYESGCILLVEPGEKRLISRHFYTTPAACRPDVSDPSILFKSGTVHNGKLFVCTQTEVLIYAVPDFVVEKHISLPFFNDLHHVVPTRRNTLLTVSTGLDLVLEITFDGAIVNEWFTTPESNWSRFCKNTDYRKIVSTKPHASHPNFAFEYDGHIWSTRFEQKDALCLTSERQIDIATERPHDGHIFNELCFFTTVDGHVVVADMKQKAVVQRHNLSEFDQEPGMLGWCRGLCVIDENNVIVSFSRIRPTKFHRNLLWIKNQISNSDIKDCKPTRIAHYDLRNKRVVWEMELETYDMNAVFSVLPAETSKG